MTNRRIFLKEVGLGTTGIGLMSLAAVRPTLARDLLTPLLAGNGDGLPRGTPEAQGVSSEGILAFVDAIGRSRHEFHSFMVARHGKVVAEGWWSPYRPEFNHALYSLSKSFTSTAVGLAVTEGKLTVEDHVVKFFPEELPDKVTENLAALRVKHLLTMSAGQEPEATWEMVKHKNWVKAFLAWPFPHRPGSVFLYNSSATYMLSAIVQKVTGQKVVDYLAPSLFEPLAIPGVTWETCPRGINTGGWGLSIRTEGLAKFGQLYLRKGAWKGLQLLPAKWVEEATTFKIQQPLPPHPSRPNSQNDWLQGYCYQFWRCTHNAFRGDGAFGQYTIVMPEKDAVVAITSETSDMQGELDLVWKHLLGAMKDEPLSPNPEGQARLRQTLSSLALALPEGNPSSPLAGRLSGRRFRIDENTLGIRGAQFTFHKAACAFTLSDAHTEYPITCGIGHWAPGQTALPGTPPRLVSGGAPKPGTPSRIASAAAWKDEDTLSILIRYCETPHHDSVTCRFNADKLEIQFINSMAAMSAHPNDPRPVLRGRMLT
jgi:CubicO group peptidase (beta-lactamase class C family)